MKPWLKHVETLVTSTTSDAEAGEQYEHAIARVETMVSGTGEHLDGHLPGQGLFVLGEVLDAISADFFAS